MGEALGIGEHIHSAAMFLHPTVWFYVAPRGVVRGHAIDNPVHACRLELGKKKMQAIKLFRIEIEILRAIGHQMRIHKMETYQVITRARELPHKTLASRLIGKTAVQLAEDQVRRIRIAEECEGARSRYARLEARWPSCVCPPARLQPSRKVKRAAGSHGKLTVRKCFPALRRPTHPLDTNGTITKGTTTRQLSNRNICKTSLCSFRPMPREWMKLAHGSHWSWPLCRSHK